MTTRFLLRSRLFWFGLLLLLVGSGPLLVVMTAASLGWTEDANPNPVGFGIMALASFWPGLIMMALGLWRSRRRGE